MPVDESLGLVDDYLTRPAAELGLPMMGHCTAREAAAFFAKTGAMTPSVSTLQRLTLSMHECWESLGPETLGSIREAEGIPQDATTASVSLDGVMVPLRPGEDGRAKASWRECQWRSKKGPPRRCKKGPLGGCGLVPVVHGRAPRATRRALNRLTRRRAREGPVGPRGQAWAGWSVQLAVGV